MQVNINAVLTALKAKKQPLSADLLMRVIDSQTTSYHVLDLLCDYINALQMIERNEDAAYICKIKQELKLMNSKFDNLNSKYNECMTELLESKENEINLSKNMLNIKNAMVEKDNKIKEYECEIERLKLFS